MKRQIKIVAFAVILIGIAAIMAGLYLYNKKSRDVAKTMPDFIITASALQKAFEDNESGASTIYINKILEVSGRIASVKPSENNVVSIALATENDFSSIICTFSSVSDPTVFSVGEVITVRGECSGYLMDVLLNNCAIIKTER